MLLMENTPQLQVEYFLLLNDTLPKVKTKARHVTDVANVVFIFDPFASLTNILPILGCARH